MIRSPCEVTFHHWRPLSFITEASPFFFFCLQEAEPEGPQISSPAQLALPLDQGEASLHLLALSDGELPPSQDSLIKVLCAFGCRLPP